MEPNKNLQPLWDAWESLGQQAQAEIFAKHIEAACQELKRRAACFARIGTKDEDIYNRLITLMGVYHRVIAMGTSLPLENPHAQQLLTGICEVLASRLKEFEEAGIQPGQPNPVTLEKEGILASAAKGMGSHFSAKEGGKDSEMETIYKHFSHCLRRCLIRLDDLYSRQAVNRYLGLIEREWEELGNIIKVQVLALETAITQGVEALPEVHLILNTLREAYQQTGPDVEAIKTLFATAPEPYQTVSYEEFTHIIPTEVETHIPDSTLFRELLNKEALGLFCHFQKDLARVAYQNQLMVSNNKLLGEDIGKVFATIKCALPQVTLDNAPEADDPGFKDQLAILQGIAETIDIKLESLEEHLQVFEAEGFRHLRQFGAERANPTPQDIAMGQETLYQQWLAAPPGDILEVSTLLQNVLNEDVYVNFGTKISKNIATYMESIQKFAHKFQRETLLYEICTYEEILIHSVSRLRDSTWEAMSLGADLLDDAYNSLETLLSKNNITPIRPEPKEMFNAFCHDVLLAEKQEGFAKGEIIKMMNTGYRQGDTVLVRANVIAAL